MLALIAGQGKLPAVLLENIGGTSRRETGDETLPYIASPEGHLPDSITPDRVFRLEHLGSLIGDLQNLGIREICFAGAVSRPEIDPSKIDASTLPLVPRIASALQKGDDGALRVLLAIFEEAGFKIRPAHEFAEALLPDAGTFTIRRLDDQDKTDIARAAQVLAALGPLDVGQSCVVRHGQVLAIEGKFGTDWMLNSLKQRPDGSGGIFYKAAKPGQDRRIDLPVVGVDTLAAAHKAGLEGVAVEENGVMVLDLDAVVRTADELDLSFSVHRP